MAHLSSKAVLVNLSIRQWVARKLDRRASNEIARLNGADLRAGNYNKSLLPTCNSLGAVKKETAMIREDFYRNVLPWGIEGTYILTSSMYMDFMQEHQAKRSGWDSLVSVFLDGYDDAVLDAQRILGSLYKASEYPAKDVLALKFSMDLRVLPVPMSGDFRVELADAELEAMEADVEKRVTESAAVAMKDVWQRLYDKVSWLQGRLADPKTTFHDETYNDAQDLVGMLSKLNFNEDADLERLRLDAETKLFKYHPQALRNDPILRTDTADDARKIMDKMSVFMGGL